ncbi:MAG: hypothetical protein R2707_13075 [Acidimicrobiales bacterium]
MQRHLEPTDLDHGTWLRLDCGHPPPPQRRPDGTADCPLCDRAQLPVGLVAAGPPTLLDGHDRSGHELAPAAWSTLTVEAGTATVVAASGSSRCLTTGALVVLVPGTAYQVTPGSDAVLALQPLHHPAVTAAVAPGLLAAATR